MKSERRGPPRDAAIASSVSSLQTTVTNNFNTLNTAITNESNARSSAIAAEASKRESLSTIITGLANPSGATLAALTSGLIFEERQARSAADSAINTSISGLSSQVGSISSTITDLEQTVATLNTASAQNVTTLLSTTRRLEQAQQQAAENLAEGCPVGWTPSARPGRDSALVQQEFRTNLQDGLLAEATARQTLAAKVDANAAAIQSEATARATADSSLSQQITNLTATVTANTNTLNAAIQQEATTRANADSTG